MAFKSFCCQGEFVCSLLWILWGFVRIQRHDKLQADLGASCEYDGDM